MSRTGGKIGQCDRCGCRPVAAAWWYWRAPDDGLLQNLCVYCCLPKYVRDGELSFVCRVSSPKGWGRLSGR